MATINDIAYVVGIDNYADAPLFSCVNDARRVADLLGINDDRETPADGTPNYTVLRRAVGQHEERQNLRQVDFLLELSDLLREAAGHNFLFYFSGHGATSAWGSEIILSDGLGVAMPQLLHLFHSSRCREIVIILDCCFSGSYGVQPTSGGDRFAPTASEIRDGMVLLAASRKDQTALSGTPCSAFTELIVAGLEGSAANYAGEITALSLFGYAAPAFGPLDQRPVFKASIASNTPLRTVRADVRLGVLRKISDHFGGPSDSITLDPATDVPGSERFNDLLALRQGGLLRSDDDRALAVLASEGASVVLSPAGWHLWTLASRGQL